MNCCQNLQPAASAELTDLIKNNFLPESTKNGVRFFFQSRNYPPIDDEKLNKIQKIAEFMTASLPKVAEKQVSPLKKFCRLLNLLKRYDTQVNDYIPTDEVLLEERHPSKKTRLEKRLEAVQEVREKFIKKIDKFNIPHISSTNAIDEKILDELICLLGDLKSHSAAVNVISKYLSLRDYFFKNPYDYSSLDSMTECSQNNRNQNLRINKDDLLKLIYDDKDFILALIKADISINLEKIRAHLLADKEFVLKIRSLLSKNKEKVKQLYDLLDASLQEDLDIAQKFSWIDLPYPPSNVNSRIGENKDKMTALIAKNGYCYIFAHPIHQREFALAQLALVQLGANDTPIEKAAIYYYMPPEIQNHPLILAYLTEETKEDLANAWKNMYASDLDTESGFESSDAENSDAESSDEDKGAVRSRERNAYFTQNYPFPEALKPYLN